MSALIHCEEFSSAAETCSGCKPFCARKLFKSARNAQPSLSGTSAGSARGRIAAQVNRRSASFIITLVWIITELSVLGGKHPGRQMQSVETATGHAAGR